MTEMERLIAYEALMLQWSGGKPGRPATPERLAKTKQYLEVCLRDGWPICAYCDLDLVRYDSLFYLDHINPRLKGTPEDGLDNLVAVCRDCNALKGWKFVPEGENREKRITSAREYVRRKRAARTLGARYDLLAELLRG